MAYLPTASKLGLARQCVYSWTSGMRGAPFEANAYADYGNAVHAAADALVKGVVVDLAAIALANNLTPTDTRRLERSAKAVGDFLAAEAEGYVWRTSEVPLAYHPGTGAARSPKSRGPRDYSDVRHGELSGTTDFVALAPPYLVIRDWKTGRQSSVEPPATNAQLRFLALAAARTYGASLVQVELGFIDEADVFISSAIFDELDLAEIAAELSVLVVRLGQREPPNPGAHCAGLYCPIVATCPATVNALAAVDSASEMRFPLSVAIESAEHAADTRHRLKVVREACDQIEGALKDWVRTNGPISAGDGKLYGLREATRETIDLAAPNAYVTLVRHLGEDGAGEAVELKTTKAAIHRAVVATTPKCGARKAEDALLDELRGLGAVRVSVYENLEEYKEKTA